MNGDTKLQRLFQILRGCGAAMIIAAAGTFLVQSWDEVGDVSRYLALLGATALLPVTGILCGVRFRESRSARTLVLAFLAVLTIHAGVLGGFVLSQLGAVDTALAPVAQWVAPSPLAALLLVGGAAALLLPMTWASFRILARPHAGALTAAAGVTHALMLVPDRGVAVATSTIVAILGLGAWLAARIKPQTREAKLATASIVAPAVVIAARQILFYDVTSAFWAAVMGAFAIGLFALGRRSGDETVERAAVVPTIVSMGALSDQIGMQLAISGPQWWLGFGLLTGVAFMLFAWQSRSCGGFFLWCAMLLNAFTAVTTLLWTHAAEPWAALQAIALGLGFVSYGFITGRRRVLYPGIAVAALGFVIELRHAIESFQPSGWLALGGAGIALVGLTAWLEKRARAVRPREDAAKLSREPTSALPG